MKAYYRTILRGEFAHKENNEKPEDVYEYILIEITDFCCNDMQEALNDGAIGFGEFHDRMINQNKDINFTDCSPYPEGAVWSVYGINYCPFCAKKVETEEKERFTRKKVEKIIPEQIVIKCELQEKNRLLPE